MLLSKKLLRLIEENADELTRKWIAEVRSREDLPTYHTYDEKALYKRAFSVYSQLGKWLSKDTTKADIARQYVALGKRRRQEGFALAEVLQALIITRRILWFKVQADGFLDDAISLKAGMDLNNSVVLFFDRAAYFVAKGYEKD
jgi:hypothetical protein